MQTGYNSLPILETAEPPLYMLATANYEPHQSLRGQQRRSRETPDVQGNAHYRQQICICLPST